MVENDSPLRQALRLSQNAQALGYHEVIILDDYFSENAEGRSSIPAYNELALNYLAQGYLRRAYYDTLMRGHGETALLIKNVGDPDVALSNLIVVMVELRYAGPAAIDICEMEFLRV